MKRSASLFLIGVLLCSGRPVSGREPASAAGAASDVGVLAFNCGDADPTVRQNGLVLRLVARKPCSLARGRRFDIAGVVSVRVDRGRLRIVFDPRHRPSWAIEPGRLVFSHPTPVVRVSADATQAVNSLVPGLPTPFIATVEGQVSRLLSRPLAPPLPVNPDRDLRRSSDRTEALDPANTASPGNVSSEGSGDLDLGVSSDAGAAVLRQGQVTDIVIDRPLPAALITYPDLDLKVSSVDQGTLLELRQGSGAPWRLAPVDGRWALLRSNDASRRADVDISRTPTALALGVARPGRVMVVASPEAGDPLLVGTVRGAIHATPNQVRTPFAEIEQTEDGVAVRPWSGRLVLRARPAGFELALDDGSAGRWMMSPDPRSLLVSRASLFPDLSVAALWRKLRSDNLAASITPERERAQARLTEASVMVSLGLVAEAAAVMKAAVLDDPRATNDDRYGLLRSIVVALDPLRGADLAASSRSDASDEASSWHVIADEGGRSGPGRPEQLSEAVRTIIPIIATYPTPLRDLVSAKLAGLLLERGKAANLPLIGGLPPSSERDFASAVADERLGQTATAERQLAGLSLLDDPTTATRSLLELLPLRAKLGIISDAAAADQIGRRQLDWRLIGASEHAGLAEADLRARAGQLRTAFRLCRELEGKDPATRAAADALLVHYLGGMTTRNVDRRVSGAEIVGALAENEAWTDAHPDLALRLEPVLAGHLEADGLPAEAADVLGRILSLQRQPDRAGTAIRIAALRADAGQVDAAREMLLEADRAGVPSTMADRRVLVGARLAMAAGRDADALTLIAGQSTDEAAELRATIAEHRQDWKAVERAIEPLVARLRSSEHLDASESALVLRLATAASRSGDTVVAADCSKQFASRLSDGASRAALLALSGT